MRRRERESTQLPQICSLFQRHRCNYGETCTKLHICERLLNGGCVGCNLTHHFLDKDKRSLTNQGFNDDHPKVLDLVRVCGGVHSHKKPLPNPCKNYNQGHGVCPDEECFHLHICYFFVNRGKGGCIRDDCRKVHTPDDRQWAKLEKIGFLKSSFGFNLYLQLVQNQLVNSGHDQDEARGVSVSRQPPPSLSCPAGPSTSRSEVCWPSASLCNNSCVPEDCNLEHSQFDSPSCGSSRRTDCLRALGAKRMTV